MNYRKIGTTNISISEIGFGTWGIGGNRGNVLGYGPTNENEMVQLVCQAVGNGINYFDTAPLYGSGQSEKILGLAHSVYKKKFIVSSKVGFDENGCIDFTLKGIQNSVERSLKRLKREIIDILFLHSPDILDKSLVHNSIEAFQQLKDTGKVCLLGISGKSPQDCLDSIEVFRPNIRTLLPQDITSSENGWISSYGAPSGTASGAAN